MIRIAMPLSMLSLFAGCSLILDGKGLHDGVDPDAPSAPSVVVVPHAPDTTSTLAVELVVPSTSPLGEEVAYEYAWSADGSPASNAPTVDSNATTRGEMWSVRVTPVGVTSGLRGRPSTTSVYIGNAAPQVRNVGLTNYQPIVGDRVRVVVDAMVDPDGDAVTPRFQWYANGAPIPGQTGDELMLAELGAAPGDRIEVEVVGSDGTDSGPPVRVRDVVVRAKVPRWEPLSPSFQVVGPGAFHPDPNGMRWVFVSGNDLWELVERPDGELRVAWLGPNEGPESLWNAASVVDVANRRAIVLTNGDPDADVRGEIWALSFEPGAQPWTKLNPGGVVPASRRQPHLVYDSSHGRAILYGGLDADEGVRGDFHALSLTPGAEAWAPIPFEDTAPHAGVALVADPSRDRILVLGGSVEPHGDESCPPNAGRIAELRHDSTGAFTSFVVRSETLPREALHMGATLLPSGDEIVLAYGVCDDWEKETVDAIHRVRLTDFTATALAIPSDEHVPSESPRLHFDAARGVVTLWDGHTWDASGHALRRYALDLTTERISLDFGWGREFPSRAYRATVALVGDDVVWMPVSTLATGSLGDVWRFDTVTKKIRPDRVLPDPVHDAEPSSFHMAFETPLRTGLVGFVTYGSGQAWTVEDDGASLRWIFHDVATPLAVSLNAATVWDDPCVNTYSSGSYGAFNAGSHHGHACASGGHDCSWTSSPPITQNISTRSRMASANAGLVSFLFGGRYMTTDYNHVFRRTRSGGSCASSFTAVTPNGTPPSGLNSAQATWDDVNRRFFVGGGVGMSSIWLLEFGAASNPSTTTPTWRELSSLDVAGPWYSPSTTSRMAWHRDRLVLARPNGSIMAFFPEG
jgi:hypothetical protein